MRNGIKMKSTKTLKNPSLFERLQKDRNWRVIIGMD